MATSQVFERASKVEYGLSVSEKFGAKRELRRRSLLNLRNERSKVEYGLNDSENLRNERSEVEYDGGNMSALESYMQRNLPFIGYEAEIEEPRIDIDIIPNQKSGIDHILKMTYRKGDAQLSLSFLESDITLDKSELKYFGEKHLGERTIKAYSFPHEFGNTGDDVLDEFASSKNLYLVFTTNRSSVDHEDPLHECLSRADVKRVNLRESVLGHGRLSLKMYSAMLERERDRSRRIMLGENLRRLYLLITKLKES